MNKIKHLPLSPMLYSSFLKLQQQQNPKTRLGHLGSCQEFMLELGSDVTTKSSLQESVIVFEDV